ncbi:MAG: PKD domain-containing protein, partial [Bacteroides sp.]|nr:PKD domain-containing protein [Bacteroides sp.]
FYFYGEEGATYKVDWGDGEKETVTGIGTVTEIGEEYNCSHNYSSTGTYTVLLYGVAPIGK